MLTTVGKYQIVEKIGVGGFGSVYKGRDPFIKRLVAIKTCQSDEEEIKKRFFREAEFAGNLHHRNITTIYDFGVTEEGVPYIVQEFLTGEDLDKKIKAREPMPLARKVRILLDICEGLGYAHQQGIVHRDIKPSNIRILEDGTVKIMDFGIAKSMVSQSTLTQTGITLGTASYLAPEQIRGEEVDPRTDLFSLGVLAYELLLLVKPFTGEHISTVLYKILNEQPPTPHDADTQIPPELSEVVMKSISKARDDRPASCAQLRSDLIAAAAFLPEDVPGTLRAAPIGPGGPDDDKTMPTPSGGLQTMGGGAPRPQTRSLADTPVRSASMAAAAGGANGALGDVRFQHAEESAAAISAPEGGSPLKLFLISLFFVLVVGGAAGWFYLKGSLPFGPRPTPAASAEKPAPLAPDAATVAATATAATAGTAAATGTVPPPQPTKPPVPTATPPPQPGTALVRSNYYADLTIDGQKVPGGVDERSRKPIPLKAGRHRFVFSTAGVPDVEKTVEIRPGEKADVSAEFPPRGQLKVEIAYEARDALLYVDDRPVQTKAPFTKMVKAGPHKVVAVLEGYETYRQEVVVPEQDRTTLKIVMKRLAPSSGTP